MISRLFGLAADATEDGLLLLDRGLGRLRGAVPIGARRAAAPVDGPRDADDAVAELANRMLRLALSGRTPAEWPRAAADAVAASLPSRLLGELSRRPTGVFELPLAAAGLVAHETLRLATACRAVRPEVLPDFAAFVTEIFSDLRTYFSLAYDEEIERWRRRVERCPGDTDARTELARTLIKCGLYEEALGELDVAARIATRAGSSDQLSRIHYQVQVAAYRAGDDERGLAAGAARLARQPEDPPSRHWAWLAAERRGGYPRGFPVDARMQVRDGFHPTGLELEDVAEEIGLAKVSGGRGTAVFDATGDGTLDVVVAGAHAGCSLFLNRGDGTFTDASTGSGLDRCVYAFALAAGDYDNDGNVDLFVTGLGFFDGQGLLWHNDGLDAEGRPRFVDVTRDAGLDLWGPGFTATWVDYDRDGWLDLFVIHNLGGFFDRKTPNRLFRNNRDGTFSDVTEEAGLLTPWPSLGAVWADFSNDGWPDLFVSNLGRAQLFRNNRDGTFREVGRDAGIAAPAIGSGAFAVDIDEDGWLDIVQLTYSRPGDAIFTLEHGHGPPGGQPLRIWRNGRDGTFRNVAAEYGLTGCWGTMSGNAGDVDNDGRLDLLLGNGDPSMDRSEASVLYQRQGERFRNVTFAAGMPRTGKGHGVNLADLGGDGRLHLIVGAGGLYPGDLLATTVHRPRRVPGRYLNLRLVGTASNRDAIGARVALHAGGRVQHRLVSGGSGFGCLPLEQHFGLGTAGRVDAIEIRWPSGASQRLEDLPVDDTVRIVEGQDGYSSIY